MEAGEKEGVIAMEEKKGHVCLDGWRTKISLSHMLHMYIQITQHMFTSFLLSSVKHWEKVKPISTAHETSMTSIKHYCLLVAKLMKSQLGSGIALILCVCVY